jgi:hypothetical protein
MARAHLFRFVRSLARVEFIFLRIALFMETPTTSEYPVFQKLLTDGARSSEAEGFRVTG